MPLAGSLAEFGQCLPPSGSLLALDPGKRRLGLAGTDPGRSLVTPLHTILRKSWPEDLARLRATVREREVVGLVVGLPLNMDGSRGPRADAAYSLARILAERLDLPVHLHDERLTSFAVEDAIAEGRLQRPRQRGAPLDHFAAAVILEDCLRALRTVASPKGAEHA
jgi:putative Holliday junction resolvase